MVRPPPRAGSLPPRAIMGAWWTLAVLFAIYTFSFVDRLVLTLVVPDIQRSLNATDTQMGLLLGPAFAIAYAVSGIPFGWAADRFSRRWVLFFGGLIFALSTGASAFATGFAVLFILRVGVGIGESAMAPCAYSLLADSFPRNQFTTASAIYNTAAKVGSSIAYGLGGAVIGLSISYADRLPKHLSSWQYLFLASGSLTLLATVMLVTVREPARSVRATPAEMGQKIFAYLSAERVLYVPLLLGFSTIALCNYAVSSWTPTYLVRRFGWGPSEFGPILGVISIGSAMILVLKGLVVDRLYGRGMIDAHVRFYTWLLVIGLPAAFCAYTIPNRYVFLFLYAGLQLISLPAMIYMGTTLQLIAPPALRGRVTAAFMFVFTLLGGVFGPPAVGVLTQYVFRDPHEVGMAITIVLSIGMPVSLILLRRSLKHIRAAHAAAESIPPHQGVVDADDPNRGTSASGTLKEDSHP